MNPKQMLKPLWVLLVSLFMSIQCAFTKNDNVAILGNFVKKMDISVREEKTRYKLMASQFGFLTEIIKWQF